MNGKILVVVYVPMLEKEYDIYVPVVKKIGTIKNLLISLITEENEGTFVDDGSKKLYDKASGEALDDNMFVKYSELKNGTKLVLY